MIYKVQEKVETTPKFSQQSIVSQRVFHDKNNKTEIIQQVSL